MTSTDVVRVRYRRTPYLVVTTEQHQRKDVYGSIDDAVVRQAQLLRGETDSDTAFVAMHPIGSPGYLPAFSQLARSGFHVVACGTRYTTGDAGLQMENALLDLAACVRDAKERLGYRRIILAGWSGGGSLMAGYQAEAERRTITATAAGESTPLADTELIPADGLMLMAAHRSRHRLISDFLDPSIRDEDRPKDRDPELNIYDPDNPNQAPYSPAYVARYRAAQRERNARITARALAELDDMRRAGRDQDESCFVVHGTMADPRWVDPTVDPNDRRPGWSYLGEPRVANDGPAGLARFCTTRGWLSQWSLAHAQVDAVDAAPRITVPTLVVANSADDAVPAEHPRDFFAALPSGDKEFREIVGANHYFSGKGAQLSHLDEASLIVRRWFADRQFSAAL
ncbi:MAG TPA: alpha/beta hydrolase [Pseudonocardia sp.]|uniref:alpha/beta hydrolase n=1 Tax=Pseudonocardia sp. TaxID=60912 RepID=UPI002C7D0CF2|nr:alpha/beta hydrolase [Pseudonocardia sp.]HTF54602.1 alpha/beta hydrolase [Pseudonocardia sp.]